MLKKKLQDLKIYLSYNFACLHPKEHSAKQFRKQYVLGEEIGRGGFGIVYKAHRIEDNLPVAVKFIERRHVRQWSMCNGQLIPSEICHLELCSDIPGVVRLIDWFTSTKGFLVVMERPERFMDLFDVLSAYGRLDEQTARRIFVQVVDIVFKMNSEHSLIHRDIKDENVILDMKTGDVKLCDFGAADFVNSATKKTFQGTKSYCPPEVFKRQKYLPLESTSWSLGVLLYILLVGSNPFKNEIHVVLGKLSFPAYISPECQALIRRCLCTSPDRRATLAEIRAHPWMNVPLEVYTQAFHTILRKRSVKRKTRRRRGRSAVDFSSDEEDETEDNSCANLARFPETNGAISLPVASTNVSNVIETIKNEPIIVHSENVVTKSKPDRKVLQVARCTSCYENISESIPLPQPLSERKESLEIYHSISSSLAGYETAASTVSQSIDDDLHSSAYGSYFSARESLSEVDIELSIDVRENEDEAGTPCPPSVNTLIREPSIDSEDTTTEATIANPIRRMTFSDSEDEATIYENHPTKILKRSSRRSQMERRMLFSRKDACQRSVSLRVHPNERVCVNEASPENNRRFRGVKSYEALASTSSTQPVDAELLSHPAKPLPRLETRRTSNGYQLFSNDYCFSRVGSPANQENQAEVNQKKIVRKCPTGCSNNSFGQDTSRFPLAVFDVNSLPVAALQT